MASVSQTKAKGNNKPKVPLSKQAIAINRATKRAEAEHLLMKEARVDLVQQANRLLAGFGSRLHADLGEDGRLTLVDVDNGTTHFDESPSHELLARGAVCQGAAMHLKSMLAASTINTFEGRLNEVLTASMPSGPGAFAHDGPRVAGLLVRAFWLLCPDPAVRRAAVLVAQTTPSARIAAAMLVGTAALNRADRAEGSLWGSRTLADAPVLTRLARGDVLGRRVARGVGAVALGRPLGAGLRTFEIPPGAIGMVSPGNVAQVEDWLGGLRERDVGLLPQLKLHHWRSLLSAMNMVSLNALWSPPGFADWYLRHRASRILDGIKVEPVTISDLAHWAFASLKRRGGWKPSMDMDKAVASFYAWMAKPPASAEGVPPVALEQDFQPFAADGLCAVAASTNFDLFSWGQELQLCLERPEYNRAYAAAVKAKQIIMVGIFSLVSKRGGLPVLVSVAELAKCPVTGEVYPVQHRGKANSEPPRRVHAVLLQAIAAQSATEVEHA